MKNWGRFRELDLSVSDKMYTAIRGYTGNDATLLWQVTKITLSLTW